ncbi:M48 family metallopeptidase [Hydrogenophaga sp. NFH-34]|uniref:M48 family metallopeptidase n=1 Tax=Hydrogenophaga sp. NFH-34 TaxID=2744446 RepID=UPI001F3B8462|nr:SprT family zinc-dependent metalloprotease [Hydrogenophaga sp. NFH-34]
MQRFVQLALDFLAGPDPARAPMPAPSPPAPSLPPVSAPPAEPLHAVFQPGTWHHPRANRLLRLGHCDVAYEFKRGKRRTIGLSVGADGLTVSAPRWTPLGEVEALLQAKSAWVLEKLQKAQARAGELARARTVWADGAEFHYLGQRVLLQLDPAHGFASVGAELCAGDDGAPARLRLGLPKTASEAQIRDAAQAWLMRQAQPLFVQRLDHFAPLLGVRYTRLRLSSAGTRWGSASADGTIRLNWRLIHLSPDMLDYVVVHELSHLRHMDHSPQFWDVVASVMPDHAQRRKALQQAAVPLGE